MQQLPNDESSEGHQQDESGNVDDAAEDSRDEAKANCDFKPWNKPNERNKHSRGTEITGLHEPIWTKGNFRYASKHKHPTDDARTQPRNEFGAHEVNLVSSNAGGSALEKHQRRLS